jgi:hypothetical protein
MEFKGTKGKWDLQNDRFIWGRVGQLIVEIHPTYTEAKHPFLTKPTNEYKANALLISKAPEILEMLKDVKDYLGSDKREQIEQLIKEATEL